MKKLLAPLIVLIIVGVVITFAIMPSTPAATEKLKTEISSAINSGKVVFLQLSSSGCVTCRKMKPEVEKAISTYNNKPYVEIINIDVNSHSSLASQYAVTGVPTQVILDKNGKEAFRNMGYMSFDSIKSTINRITNK
ncbi:MAG: hypothetical protein C0603_03475 [Denitrovibrio sp.]|nr:MAG: hypothetical protein C0603_03475 [Denitrovibrio sp.]